MPFKLLFIYLLLAFFCCAQQKTSNTSTLAYEVMFYNVENFFDTIDDKSTDDYEYLPTSKKAWNTSKYVNKTNSIAKVINAINGTNLPDIIGFCEIENRKILEDIKTAAKLTKYAIVHFESPDNRGIDVGMMYDSTRFKLIYSKPIYIQFCLDMDHVNSMKAEEGLALMESVGSGQTRSILKVSLLNGKDTIHLFVNHFPSRRGGKENSEFKRIDVAEKLKAETNKLFAANTLTKIIVMGDFNDAPTDSSIHKVLGAVSSTSTEKNALLFNLFYEHSMKGEGSYKYNGKMDMLDQIIASKNIATQLSIAEIFAPDWLKQKGKYDGYPLRTFGGKDYLNGYSDHFPIIAKFNQ